MKVNVLYTVMTGRHNDLLVRIGLYVDYRTADELANVLPAYSIRCMYIRRLMEEEIDLPTDPVDLGSYYWTRSIESARTVQIDRSAINVSAYIYLPNNELAIAIEDRLTVIGTSKPKTYKHHRPIVLFGQCDNNLFFLDDELSVYIYIFGIVSARKLLTVTKKDFSARQFVYRGRTIDLYSEHSIDRSSALHR